MMLTNEPAQRPAKKSRCSCKKDPAFHENHLTRAPANPMPTMKQTMMSAAWSELLIRSSPRP